MIPLPWWADLLLDIDGGITDMVLEHSAFEALISRCQVVTVSLLHQPPLTTCWSKCQPIGGR